MKLLNDLVLRTKTHQSDFGEILSELGHIDLYGKYRSIVYYDNGINEIDQLFNEEAYIFQEKI